MMETSSHIIGRGDEPARPIVVILRSDSGRRDSRLQKEMRGFAASGYDTKLLCWDRAREAPARESVDGVEIIRCHFPAPYGSRWLFAAMPLWWLWCFFQLLGRRVNVIHACDFDTAPPAWLAARLTGARFVYDIYDFYSVKSDTIPAWLKGLFRKAEAWLASRADGVILVDEARVYLLDGRVPARMVIAMNCPMDAVLPYWRKPDSGPLTVFYGGLIARYRGIEKLLDVMAEMEGVRLLIAGWCTCPELAARIEAAPNTRYLGCVSYEEALRLTYECDAVYSYYDPALEINLTANSSKMFDAFMCATAVLANAEPPAAAVVGEYDCGALLLYADDDGLRDTLLIWRDDRSIPRRLGANGRRHFEAGANWDLMWGRIMGLYTQIGAAPPAGGDSA